MIRIFLFLLLTIDVFSAVAPPVGWGDFQMGIVNNRRTDWDVPMKAALEAGVQFDRRYIYITDASEVKGSNAFIFPEGWGTNYSTDPYFIDKGVRPTLTVYMLQKGADGLDAVINGCADKAHMASYFEALIHTVDKSKGVKPIYVIEPDVWGYLVQNFEADLAATNLAKTCHINDLGYPHLDEFSNTIKDLAKAIIKTIKINDPEAYAGILMAHWGFGLGHEGVYTPLVEMNNTNAKRAAIGGAEFLDTLLGDTWRGDFMGVEKNGADAGWYLTVKGESKDDPNNSRYWKDENNATWVYWASELSQAVNLPLVGWQICLGHEGLPNTPKKFEDTFFEYFFDNTSDFIDAGFIGIMSGCNNQGIGTTAEYNSSEGDGGWFYGKLTGFNAGRPYLSETTASLQTQRPRSGVVQFSAENQSLLIQEQAWGQASHLYRADGQRVQSFYSAGTYSLQGLSEGTYYLQSPQESLMIRIAD